MNNGTILQRAFWLGWAWLLVLVVRLKGVMMSSNKPPGPPGPYPPAPQDWGVSWPRWPLGPAPSYVGDQGPRQSVPGLPPAPVQPPAKPEPLPPPPPRPQLPLPLDVSPALPSAPMGTYSGEGMPSLDVLERWSKQYVKGGALNVLAPLPWDSHEYPKTPQVPDEAIKGYDRDVWLTQKLKKWWDEQTKRDEDEERGPEEDPRKLLPPPTPEGVSRAGIEWAQLKRRGVGPAPADSLQGMAQDYIEAAGLIGDTPLEMFDAYIKSAGIRYFSGRELCKHNWFKTKVSYKPELPDVCAWAAYLEFFPPDHPIQFVMPGRVVPDPRMWPNLIPLLRIVDRFRHWLGAPVNGVSGYRLEWYNTQIKGSKRSYHLGASALDFSYSAKTPQGDIDAAIFWRWLNALYFVKGQGVGAYRGFIHFDTGMPRIKEGRFLRWIHRKRRVSSDVFGGLPFNWVGQDD